MNKNTYKLLFEEPEKESKQIDNLRYCFFRGKKHTKENIDKVKEDVKFLVDYEKDYFYYKELDDLIQYLTSKMCQGRKQRYIKEIQDLDIVNNINEVKRNHYVINTIDGKISFCTIDGIVSEKDKLLNSFEDEEELKTYYNKIANFSTRVHKCHYLGIYSSQMLEEYFNIKNYLVTGYTCFATEKSKYLHSWNEFEYNGEQYVLDSTLNVIMNKEGYYLLRHIEEIVEKIESDKIISDYEKYGEIINKLGIKVYVTSRDLIIKEIEKNFNNSREER